MTIRVLLLLFFAPLMPALVAGMQFLERRDAEIATAQHDLAAAARQIARDLNDAALGTMQLHRGLSRARDLETQDRVACSAFLADVLKEYPQYLSILSFRPDGDLLCDSLRRKRELNVADRGYFQAAVNARNSLGIEPVFSRLTGNALLTVAYATRQETGEPKFVLVTSIDLERIMRSHSQRLLRRDVAVALVDGKGTVLTWHPDGDKLRGTSIADSPLFRFALDPQGDAVREDIESGGVSRIWATSALPDFPAAGLHILVGVSKLDLLAAANRNLVQALATVLVVWLLVVTGAWLMADAGVRRPKAVQPAAGSGEEPARYRQFVWRPLAAFLVFTAVVMVAGYGFFDQLTQSAKSDATKALASIGKLKAEQIRYYIDKYEKSALSIARLLGQDGLTAWLGRDLLEMPAPWRESLRDVLQDRGDDALLVLDSSANVRFGVGQYTRLTADGRRLALKAATDAIPVMSDIYQGDPFAPEQALLDVFVPIMSPDRARAAGVLVLRSNLAYLYALIQSWPVESRSAESVLVRRDGDHALILNELRFRKQSSLRMRVPLAAGREMPAWPATVAARGETGRWEALDYRGHPVLVHSLPVPGTSWGMVVKVDMEDVLEPVHKLRSATIGIAAAFILMALMALLAWLRVTRRQMNRELAEGQRIRELNESLEQRVRERTAQLRQSEGRLRLMTNSVKDYAIIMLDPIGHVVAWNEGAQHLKGYAEAEVVGQPMERFYPPEDVVAGKPAQLLALAAAEGRCEDEGLLVRRDGTRFYADVILTAMRDAAGELVGFAKITRDVTERRQAEHRIARQLEHLNLLDHITRATGERQDLKSIFQVVVRSLEDSLPIDFGCICLYDAAANTLTVTSVGAKSEALAHELMMDAQASIAIDQNGLSRCVQGQLVYEPDIVQLRSPFPERLAAGGLGSVVLAPLRSESRVFGVLMAARRAAQGFASVECEFLRQLSEHVALAAHHAQLYGSLQQAYDDLRQTQQVVMQEERLRALGQMASGIAHDINNALSPVSLYTESMLETEQNLSAQGRGYLETIQRAVEDVAQTVARMREFYRQREQQIELMPVQMNSVVHQVVDLTRPRWSDMPLEGGVVITQITDLEPNLPKVMAVESEIREALTNLIFNAVDAMPEGGTLTVRTRMAHAVPQRPCVVVEVADSGAGMDEGTRRRCLEPFFTTKGERGTGLGLAMVYGAAQRHGAGLEIDSALGAGTTVRLAFAVATEVEAKPEGAPAALEAPKRLRLLLIDDDPILLKSLRDALNTDGHVVVTANGGEAGLSMFRDSLDGARPFAAVITDLGMPYVDGRRVAAAVKEASPATPVILLTGWGQRLVAEGDIPPHVDRVLAKPPKLRELRITLAQLCRTRMSEAA
ncbi:MAG: PAS domain S-box protein [Rubrivivax sp.]|nr:PAS domain S-box protein [Rubrivivax sp.]